MGVADFEGRPSVEGVQAGDQLLAVNGIPVHGVTMGQIWSMLGGTPGQEKKLTVERSGKSVLVEASIRHFLGEAPDEKKKKK